MRERLSLFVINYTSSAQQRWFVLVKAAIKLSSEINLLLILSPVSFMKLKRLQLPVFRDVYI